MKEQYEALAGSKRAEHSLELVAGVEVTAPLGNSDHNAIEVTMLGKAPDKSSREEVPDWAKAIMEGMREKLGEVDWVVDKITRECVPTKLRRAGSRPLCMTENIMRMLRRKRRL